MIACCKWVSPDRPLLEFVDSVWREPMVQFVGRRYPRLDLDALGEAWGKLLDTAWRESWDYDDYESLEHMRNTVLRFFVRAASFRWLKQQRTEVRQVGFVPFEVRKFTDFEVAEDDSLDDVLSAASVHFEASGCEFHNATLRGAYEALSGRQREVIDLTVIGEVGPVLAGRMLGISHAAVGHYKREAITKMRRALSPAVIGGAA